MLVLGSVFLWDDLQIFADWVHIEIFIPAHPVWEVYFILGIFAAKTNIIEIIQCFSGGFATYHIYVLKPDEAVRTW